MTNITPSIMENLLNNDFLAHYGLPIVAIVGINQTTNAIYFEIEDDVNAETQLHTTRGSGQAAYKNPKQYTVSVINYDKFITNQPHAFQQGKERCDLIVYVKDHYFLLNELKDRNPTSKFRQKAKKQLLASLTLLMAVPNIENIANATTKRTCIFNKQATAPAPINAISAFNPIALLMPNGVRLQHTEIENFGFELYEYTGGQHFIL